MCDLLASDIELLISMENLITRPDYFSEEEWIERLKDIEGSQFDLTIGNLYSHSRNSSPYLGRYSRNTGDLVEEKLSFIKSINAQGWTLYEESHYVGLTGEAVNLPKDIRGVLAGRSSDYVVGIYPGVTNISPGYSGKLKFGLFTTQRMSLGVGARVITVTFTSFDFYKRNKRDQITDEAVRPYGGIWGGAKVTTTGVERPH